MIKIATILIIFGQNCNVLIVIDQNCNYSKIQAIAPYYITLFLMPPPDLWPPEGDPLGLQVIIIVVRMMIMMIMS